VNGILIAPTIQLPHFILSKLCKRNIMMDTWSSEQFSKQMKPLTIKIKVAMLK
jgi:hypothetical protein